MVVAHLTSAHPVHDVRIYVKECRTLRAAGYDVVLVAPGCADSVDDLGVRIVGRPRRRRRLGRILFTTLEVLVEALRTRAEIVHFHDPELIPSGLLLKLLGRRVIYDVHENLPDQVLNKTWLPQGFRKVIGALMDGVERAAALAFDGIVAATPQIACRFPSRKTNVVQNFPIKSEFTTVGVSEHERSPRVVYVGNIAEIRGIVQMVRAMELIRERAPKLRMSIAGAFSDPSLQDRVASMPGWQSVDFLGWQPREGIAELLRGAVAGLVVLHPTRSYMEAYPVKLFEYMAAGIPVIASDFPLWREIVGSARCGLLVNPLDPEQIAEATLWLLEHEKEARAMGVSGAEAVRSTFNWDKEAEKLTALYSRLSSQQGS